MLAFWASKAGTCGHVGKLAFAPNKQTGHYSWHFGVVCGKPKDNAYYQFEMPGHRRAMDERCLHIVPCLLPLEAVAQELTDHPERFEEHASAVAENKFPRCYYSHPVVTRVAASGVPVFACAL